MSVRSAVRAAVGAAAIFLLAGCLLALAYYHDNKYLSPPPYGAGGVLELADADLGRPVPLVDGWLLSVDGASQIETFVGQYSSFSYVPGGASAFGTAVYELELRYVGNAPERALVLLVPEVYGDFTLYADGVVAAAGGDGAEVGVVVRDGTRLKLEVENREHYYSGLYYPPVLGTAQAMGRLDFASALGTCVLVLGPLAAALLSFAVRRRGGGDALLRDFAVLCLAFAVAGAHGLAWRAGIAGAWWYALEDAAWACVLVAAVALAARAAGLPWTQAGHPAARWGARALWLLPAVTFAWAAALPALPASIGAYAAFQSAVRIACWGLFAGCAVVGLRNRSAEARFVLYGCAVLGAALAANLLDDNAYEPLYGLWQHEYAGLMLVGVFAWMLAVRVRLLRAAQEQVRDLEVQVRAAEAGLVHLRHGEREARTARHDLRHHVAALRRMADEGAWEDCRAYLDELAGQQDAAPPLRYTSNVVANAVLAAYLAPAQAAGVRVECDVRVPERLGLGATELSVLLSNLLSNAVEACERARAAGEDEPYLALSMRTSGNVLALRCENSAEPGASFLATSKENPREHGLGLPAMREIARRHRGELFAEAADGRAVVRIGLALDAGGVGGGVPAGPGGSASGGGSADGGPVSAEPGAATVRGEMW